MRRWFFGFGTLFALSLAHGSQAHAVDLVKEAPNTAFTKPTKAAPKLRPSTVVAENVRAVAVLHAIWRYERAGLFAAGDRIVADARAKKLTGPAAKAVAKLVSAHAPASERVDFPAFVAALIRDQFQAIVEQSVEQMEAYGDLVSSVSSSLDAFTKDNVSTNQERDTLEKYALVLSNAGYGAAHFAAAKLAGPAHELAHVVQQSSVQKAYGAKDAEDLVAKLSGKPRATVVTEFALATHGTELLLWLQHAREPAKLRARAKMDNVAALVAKLKKLGAFKAFTPKPAAKLPKPRPLCILPGSPKPKPCAFASKD